VSRRAGEAVPDLKQLGSYERRSVCAHSGGHDSETEDSFCFGTMKIPLVARIHTLSTCFPQGPGMKVVRVGSYGKVCQRREVRS